MPLFYLSLRISLITVFVLFAIAVFLFIIRNRIAESKQKMLSNALCCILVIEIVAAIYVFVFCVVSIFQLLI